MMPGRPRLLSDPLPLRSTKTLPTYRVDALMPWVYGTVTLSPIPMDEAGQEWLLADHAISGVHWVKDDGVETDGWELTQSPDTLGHMRAMLRLTRPAESPPAVSLSGRQHPATGALIEHPADIAIDLLRQCGWAEPDPSALRPLRETWPGVALGGVLNAAEPLREAIGRVIGALGAGWSTMPLRAWMPGVDAPLATLTQADIDDGSGSAEHGTLATRLEVAYAYDWAAGGPRETLVVEAAEAMSAYGRIDGTLDLGWVRHARDALALGLAALQDRARPRWSISISLEPCAPWRPGDRLTLAHPWLPQGAATVLGVSQDASRLSVDLSRPAGPVPAVALATRSALSDGKTATDLSITYSNGAATFTILDAAAAPLAGAAVTLDGITTRTTDRQGRVQFTTHRGAHSLLVVAEGYADMYLDVTV